MTIREALTFEATHALDVAQPLQLEKQALEFEWTYANYWERVGEINADWLTARAKWTK